MFGFNKKKEEPKKEETKVKQETQSNISDKNKSSTKNNEIDPTIQDLIDLVKDKRKRQQDNPIDLDQAKAMRDKIFDGEEAFLNQSKEFLDELEFLTQTAGGVVEKRFVQKLAQPNPKTFLGSGKLEDVKGYIKTHTIGTAIFDDELSPAQLRNVEKILNCKILDRTNLILDIFAQRAQTSSAKTQVELAQHEYLLPRLTRLWTHLDKQKGGIGGH